MIQRLILLPTDAGFYEILESSLPPDFDPSKCAVKRANSNILETVNFLEAVDYALGGELDELENDEEEEY